MYRFSDQFVNDITSGDNFCTAFSYRCCKLGFTATSGWDPVTGLGSIRYNDFFEAFASLNKTASLKSDAPSMETTAYPTVEPTISLPQSVKPSSTLVTIMGKFDLDWLVAR